MTVGNTLKKNGGPKRKDPASLPSKSTMAKGRPKSDPSTSHPNTNSDPAVVYPCFQKRSRLREPQPHSICTHQQCCQRVTQELHRAQAPAGRNHEPAKEELEKECSHDRAPLDFGRFPRKDVREKDENDQAEQADEIATVPHRHGHENRSDAQQQSHEAQANLGIGITLVEEFQNTVREQECESRRFSMWVS